MCGRYALSSPPDVLRRHFGYEDRPDFPPRYNIAPTQPVAVVTGGADRRFQLMRWGFIPSFLKDPAGFPLLFNVRSETVREKPSFRAAIMRRRCVMPADGFYMWQPVGRARRPFLLRAPDRAPFALAAIWETWSGADGSEIDTVAVLTGPANAAVAAIGDRCPVLVPDGALDIWLDPSVRPRDLDPLLVPPPDDALERVAVGPGVNRAGNDDPSIQDAVGSTGPCPD